MSAATRVRIYGLVLETDLPLSFPLPVDSGPPLLRVTVAPAAASEAGMPLYASSEMHAGQPLVSVFAVGEEYLLHFPLAGEFHVGDYRITYRPLPDGNPQLAEIYLLGTVLAFWLELRGRPGLHASAVAVGERAAVFLGTNQGGKSSLVAALLQQGAALLTDDLLVAERRAEGWLGHPAYPQLRLWPDQARHFYGETSSLPRVTADTEKLRVPVGTFEERSLPLRAIYLPRRWEANEIIITNAAPKEALVELLRYSFLARMLDACGKGGLRLPLLASLIDSVPVRHLCYPNGVEHLPRVAEAVLADG